MFEGSTNVDQFRDQYREAEEEIPDHMPHARGRSVQIFTFIDASHASNCLTRRSHSGVYSSYGRVKDKTWWNLVCSPVSLLL